MRAVRLSPTILTTFIFLTTAELMKPNTFLLQATTLLSAGNSGATLLLLSPKQVLELG